MPNTNKLELVVEVDVSKGNASIKSINTGLSTMEQTAVKAARNASRGIDSLTVSIVKGATAGSLFADAIKKSLDFLKQHAVEIVTYAARTETLGVVTQQLARANGLNGEAVRSQVESIKRLGISSQESHSVIQRMIFAELDLAKATQLARVAQDAAVIAGVNSSEALENIILGITTGQTRLLHTMGLQVSLEQTIAEGERVLGHAMSEREKRQFMLNKVLQEGVKIHGAYEAAMETAGKQMTSLLRYWQEAKNALGAEFQGVLKIVIRLAENLSKNIEANGPAWGKLVTIVGTAGAAFLAFKYNFLGVVSAVSSLGGMATLLGSGAILTTLVHLDELEQRYDTFFKRTLAAGQDFAAKMEPILKALREGEPVEGFQETLDQVVRDRLNNRVREAWSGAEPTKNINEASFKNDAFVAFIKERYKLDPAQIQTLKEHGAGLGQMVWKAIVEGWEKYGAFKATGPKIKVIMPEVPDPAEQAKIAKEIAKKQIETVRATRDAALEAQQASLQGPAKVLVQMEREAQKHTSYVDEKGIERHFTLVKEARDNLSRELQARMLVVAKESVAETRKLTEEAYHDQLAWDTQLYQKRLQMDEEWATKCLEQVKDVYQYEEERAGYARDAELRAVESTDAQTLKQKLWVEQRKAEIEIEYLDRIHEIKLRLFDLETSTEVLKMELEMRQAQRSADEIAQRIAELTQGREQIRQLMQEGHHESATAARQNATIRQGQMIRDEQRRIFDSLKQQAGGVFDALLQKSQSVWSAIGNAFKTAMLTAIKEVVSSRVAAMLMYMFTGQKVTFAQGGGGGGWGGFGGLLGTVPIFGGGGGGGLFGSGPVNGNPMILSAMAGGAPGVAAGAGGAGAGGAGGTGGGLGGFAGWGGMFSGAKGWLTNLGNIGFRPERWRMDEYGNMTKIAGARGVGGWQGGAMLAGGGILALDGLRRGGWAGVGETTAGGALIGGKFGGGVGAAIGAGVGFFAGVVRLFVKGATEKAREKIKVLYGVDISDKGVLQQIVDMAKQSYGGNLDLAIRSPQVRDLIQLYAMTTGQKPMGMPAQVTPVSLVQSGGSLYQTNSYQNGTALPGVSGLPSFDKIAAGTPSGGGLVIKLDGPATTALLRGEAVNAIVENPRAVQAAAMKSTKANSGRREMTALQLSPGTLTA